MLHWTVHLKGGPGRDYDHAAVAVGHRLFAFGGYCYGPSSAADQIDVHVFNTVSLRWRKLPPQTTPATTVEEEGGGGPCRAPDVPSRRDRHTAGLVEDVIYIWGGVTFTWEFCNVLYAFDVDAHRWSTPEVSGAVPKGRCDHSACVVGKVMYVFGGFVQLTSCHTSDIYTLDTATMVWSLLHTRGTPAPASECHSATIIGTRMFVFGGQGEEFDYNNSVSVFDTATNFWLSSADEDGVSVFDTETNCWLSSADEDEFYHLLSHGDEEDDADEEHDHDITASDVESYEYSCLLAQELEYHCCLGPGDEDEEDSYDDFCEELYEELYEPNCLLSQEADDEQDLWLRSGGDYHEDDCSSRWPSQERFCLNHHDDEEHLHEGPYYDNDYWPRTSSEPFVPAEREGHSAFAFNGELYIFGGHNYGLGRTFNDLWKFSPDTSSWTEVEAKGKVPRSWMSRMCCCAVGDRVILFGGCRFMAVPADVEDLDDDTDMYDNLYLLDLRPSLNTLSMQAVMQYGLEQSGLPHNIRWELATMTNQQQQR